MRFTSALVALAAGGILLTATPSGALPCPPPTQSQPVMIGGKLVVGACVLYLDVQP